MPNVTTERDVERPVMPLKQGPPDLHERNPRTRFAPTECPHADAVVLLLDMYRVMTGGSLRSSKLCIHSMHMGKYIPEKLQSYGVLYIQHHRHPILLSYTYNSFYYTKTHPLSGSLFASTLQEQDQDPQHCHGVLEVQILYICIPR